MQTLPTELGSYSRMTDYPNFRARYNCENLESVLQWGTDSRDSRQLEAVFSCKVPDIAKHLPEITALVEVLASFCWLLFAFL